MDEVLEVIDVEVRIAAAKSVREHMQGEPSGGEPCVMEALTDALIDLRTQQIERMFPDEAPKA